jgi:hypothetical protein
MRFTFVILLFCCLGADAQMIIKAHANYRPLAQPVANLLLDDYPNAAVAFSLRKLDKDYTGSAIRVRRSNDNSEQDIGFTSSGNLDTASLKTFIGANNAFVTTWYDQSGNARNAIQTTAALQPRIGLNGIIDTLNKRAINSMLFSGSRFNVDTLLSNEFENANQQASFFAVTKPNDLGAISRQSLFTLAGNELTSTLNDRLQFSYSLYSGNALIEGFLNIRTTINTQKIITSNPYNALNNVSYINTWIKTSTNGTSYLNNNAGTSADQTNVAITLHHATIGASIRGSDNNVADSYLGRLTELIIYNSDQSSNRTGIQNNINAYYSIY